MNTINHSDGKLSATTETSDVIMMVGRVHFDAIKKNTWPADTVSNARVASSVKGMFDVQKLRKISESAVEPS